MYVQAPPCFREEDDGTARPSFALSDERRLQLRAFINDLEDIGCSWVSERLRGPATVAQRRHDHAMNAAESARLRSSDHTRLQSCSSQDNSDDCTEAAQALLLLSKDVNVLAVRQKPSAKRSSQKHKSSDKERRGGLTAKEVIRLSRKLKQKRREKRLAASCHTLKEVRL